ncbi:hypothetical protein BSL78_00506 [Apostichopus japonicus]|uniref:Uncharacterized protein n=1 Tax=Stichopus japonicus TaxID=307972 RepID=A0A2G8LR09_STIJA|nr:hypothetical protein BSL78_00506 [Apostichopus japonicus]
MCHSALHSYSQRTYTFPAIEAHWKQLQTELLLARKGKTVVIAGDGRNDSPGHCAQYCTYSVMDYETCDILDIQVVDKREADLKSTNMEKIAFLRALETLEKSDVKVEEVVTDAHPQIKSYLSKLEGILHHVVGDHEWALGDGVSPACCQHGPLPASQKDLEPDSPAHAALREIVLDMNLIRNIKYYTSSVSQEIIPNLQVDGPVSQSCKKKTFKYIPELMKDVFRRRLIDNKSQRSHVVLAEDDPRRISGTIRPNQPPSVHQLLENHKSRMEASSSL